MGEAHRLRPAGPSRRFAADRRPAGPGAPQLQGAPAPAPPVAPVDQRRWAADRQAGSLQGAAGQRGEPAALRARGLCLHRGPPLLQPLGRRSGRAGAGGGDQPQVGSRARGRQHHHPAAGQDHLPQRPPHLRPQAAGAVHRPGSGDAADQGRRSSAAISPASISATGSTACGRRRGTTSTRRPSGSTSARRRCWRAWSRRRPRSIRCRTRVRA